MLSCSPFNYLILLTVPLKPQLQSTSLKITTIGQDTSHSVSQPFLFTGKFHCFPSFRWGIIINYYKFIRSSLTEGSGFPFLADIRLSIKTCLLQYVRFGHSSISCRRNRHLSFNLPWSLFITPKAQPKDHLGLEFFPYHLHLCNRSSLSLQHHSCFICCVFFFNTVEDTFPSYHNLLSSYNLVNMVFARHGTFLLSFLADAFLAGTFSSHIICLICFITTLTFP